eukprot:TRINITY_DN63186_c0_g1_i1.p1 TRINITY_DN63186_c0_g1~~TRINITY_DN63186_c0_g1_i1.p1  ORF type:complete len:879 (+),score=185.35 TRINITY_DN63186_c0_g1_i1:135-2771(+)
MMRVALSGNACRSAVGAGASLGCIRAPVVSSAAACGALSAPVERVKGALTALPGGGGTVRRLHKGHVGKTLEKLNLPRHHWLKEVQQAPEKSEIRRQKDKYLRELGAVHSDIRGLFGNDETAAKAVKPLSKEEARQQVDGKQQKEAVNEALRVYRLLRPEAPPFYEEDAMLGMKAKMNKTLQEGTASEDSNKFMEQQAFLPVVNHRAFLLALESMVASLAHDVETMCLLVGLNEESLPATHDPLRFKKLIEALFGAFPLRKDPSRVHEFMQSSWPRLKTLLPEPIASLPDEVVHEWLQGHLQRVRLNQSRLSPTILLHRGRENFGDEEWYNFAEDFPYDNDPLPAELIDERNLDFPLQRAGELMRRMLGVLGDSAVAEVLASNTSSTSTATTHRHDAGALDGVANQFQDLVWDLERVGLRNWLKMDAADLERFLPKGGVEPLGPQDPNDQRVAKLMLRCAARDRANLLDFEAVDPYKLLHEFPSREIEEELQSLPPHSCLDDGDLEGLVDAHCARVRDAPRVQTDRSWLDQGATVDEVFRKELDFYRTAGPAEWLKNTDGTFEWKWRAPVGAYWDKKRQVYVPEQKGVNPDLSLKEMRQHMLETKRLMSMTKSGRVFYFRAVVVVGNGRGVYGFGVGFGSSPKDARADAASKALQNLDYIDMDVGRMLPTPSKGTEYKYNAVIVPRAIGRGLRVNKKFLPLMYILGLDNCRVKFFFGGVKWFTRIRALKRALDGIQSRRTLANATGKRYALLVAPGDHWVHWPDRWFDTIREPYDAKVAYAKLSRRHALHFKKRGNLVATPVEAKPGWARENWVRWTNPLERWLQDRRQFPPYNPEARSRFPGSDSGGAPAGSEDGPPLPDSSTPPLADVATSQSLEQ